MVSVPPSVDAGAAPRYRIDVRDGQAMGQTIQDVVEHYGQLDVLINAAGIAE